MTIETELPAVAVKVRWRVFEDITRGWFGIEEDIFDGNTILYPKKINREPLDGIVRAHNAALTLKDDPGNGEDGEAERLRARVGEDRYFFLKAQAAESRCEELVKALEQAKKRMRNCRGAIESNQVVDKDVHGSLTNGMADIDAALACGQPVDKPR